MTLTTLPSRLAHALRWSALAALFGAVLVVSPAMSAGAHADVGDGTLECVRGEICFEYTHPASHQNRAGLKHYWYSDLNHAARRFGGNPGNGTGASLVDNIDGFWNRDTECHVYMWDITAQGTWYWFVRLNLNGASGYLPFSDAHDNRNNGHTRCTSTL